MVSSCSNSSVGRGIKCTTILPWLGISKFAQILLWCASSADVTLQFYTKNNCKQTNLFFLLFKDEITRVLFLIYQITIGDDKSQVYQYPTRNQEFRNLLHQWPNQWPWTIQIRKPGPFPRNRILNMNIRPLVFVQPKSHWFKSNEPRKVPFRVYVLLHIFV